MSEGKNDLGAGSQPSAAPHPPATASSASFSTDLIKFLYAREMTALLAAHGQPTSYYDADLKACAVALDAHFSKAEA